MCVRPCRESSVYRRGVMSVVCDEVCLTVFCRGVMQVVCVSLCRQHCLLHGYFDSVVCSDVSHCIDRALSVSQGCDDSVAC